MKKNIKGMRILYCQNCKRETPHDITQIGFFVTALEIPIAPYKTKYVLICRECEEGFEIKKEDFKKLLMHNEDVREILYSAKSPLKGKSKKFCRFCGAKTRKGAKFCLECGKPVF